MSTSSVGRFSEIVDDAEIGARGRALRDEQYRKIAVRTDRLFIALLAGQWLFAIALALFISPRSWAGTTSQIHPHVWFAVVVGGLLAVPPSLLALQRPGAAVTRYAIAVAQMAFGALLIHLTGFCSSRPSS